MLDRVWMCARWPPRVIFFEIEIVVNVVQIRQATRADCCTSFSYTEKNLFVNFTLFMRKFIIFLLTLGHTQNVGFLLLKMVIFSIFVANFSF